MTVLTTTSSVTYTGNGSTTAFPVNFPLSSSTEVTVTLITIATGEETVLTPVTHYTIPSFTTPQTTTITYPASGSPMAATHQLRIDRATNLLQEVNVTNQTRYDASVVMGVWDKLHFLVQELSQAVSGTLRVSKGTVSPMIANATARANRVPLFNSAGTGLIVGPTADMIENAQTASGFTFSSFGAVGDTVIAADGTISSGTDDTAALQAAFDWVNSAKGRKIVADEGAVYSVTGLTLTGGGEIDFKDSIIICTTNARVINATATILGDYDLATDYDPNVLSLDLTGNPLPAIPPAGTVMKIVSDGVDPADRDSGSNATQYRTAEFFIVGEGSTTTNIVLDRPLRFTTSISPTSTAGDEARIDSYTTVLNARVVYADQDERLRITGGKILHEDGHEATWTQGAVTVRGYLFPEITDLAIGRGYGGGLSLAGSYRARVRGLRGVRLENNTGNGQYGYLLADTGWCSDIDVTSYDVRHTYTSAVSKLAANDSSVNLMIQAGRTVGAKVTGYGFGGVSAHWDTHHSSEDVSFVDTYSEGGEDKSIALRGRNLRVSGHVSRNMASGWTVFTEYQSGDPDDDFYTAGKTLDDVTSATMDNIDIECDDTPVYVSHAEVYAGGTNTYRTKDHRMLWCAGGVLRLTGQHRFVADSAASSTNSTGIFHLTDANAALAGVFTAPQIVIERNANVTINASAATGVTGMYVFNGEATCKVIVRGRLRLVLPSDIAGWSTGGVTITCEGDGIIEYSVDGGPDTDLIPDTTVLGNVNVRSTDGVVNWNGTNDGAYSNAAPAKIRSDWAPDGTFYTRQFGVYEWETGANNLAGLNDVLGEAGLRRTTTSISRRGLATKVKLDDGVFDIEGTLTGEMDGLVLEGLGYYATVLRQRDETADLIKFGASDAYNANNDSAAAKLEGVGIHNLGLHMTGGDMTDARTSRALVLDRVKAYCSGLYIQGFHQGVTILDPSRGTTLHGVNIVGSSGGTMSATAADSAGILIGRREVSCYEAASNSNAKIDSTETVSSVAAGAFVVGRSYEIATVGTTDFTLIGSADNVVGTKFVATGVGSGTGTAHEQHFYAMGASVYLSDLQMHSSGYGMRNSLQIECLDGLYASALHLGFPVEAIIDMVATQSNLPILNVHFTALFCDDNSTLEAGSTQSAYGVRYRDPSALGTAMVDHNYSGEVNGCSTAGYLFDAPGAKNIHSSVAVTNSKTTSVIVNSGENISFNGRTFTNTSQAAGHYAHVTGGTQVRFNNVTCEGGVALQGVLVDSGVDECYFNGVHVKDAVGEAFEDNSTGVVEFNNCWADKSCALIEGKGTWTAVLKDSSGNSSPTTVTGYYTLSGHRGRIVTASFHNYNNISTAGLTAGDALQITLPFAAVSTHRQLGHIDIQNMASLTGSGRQLVTRVPTSGDYVNLVNVGSGTAGSANQLVSNISTGVTDINNFTITYERAV